MKRYKTNDKNIIWEDTGFVKVHNYPPDGRTYSYITRVYRQFKKGNFGHTEVEGEPIYFHGMTYEQKSLAEIMGTAQNTLYHILKRESFLTEIKD